MKSIIIKNWFSNEDGMIVTSIPPSTYPVVSDEHAKKIRLVKKLLFFSPLALVVVGFNCYVDPAHLFRGGTYERGITELLLAGRNVANVSNYDERLLQRYYIEGLNENKDIIVLGSSTALQIDTSLFPGKILFNHAVSGGSLEDYLAIYHLYRMKGLFPEAVIFGLDPWILNAKNGQTRWKSLEREYLEILRFMESKYNVRFAADRRPLNAKYLEAISLNYFQYSFREALRRLEDHFSGEDLSHVKGEYFPTTEEFSTSDVVRGDGSRRYGQRIQEVGLDEVEVKARSFARADQVYSMGGFDELNANAQRLFDAFINLLLDDGVEVVFFLPPYYPAIYDLLVEKSGNQILLQGQDYFIELAKNKGIKVVGSYNPSDLRLAAVDFYDVLHAKREAMRQLFVDVFRHDVAKKETWNRGFRVNGKIELTYH